MTVNSSVHLVDTQRRRHRLEGVPRGARERAEKNPLNLIRVMPAKGQGLARKQYTPFPSRAWTKPGARYAGLHLSGAVARPASAGAGRQSFAEPESFSRHRDGPSAQPAADLSAR